jgi:hypothetical protein
LYGALTKCNAPNPRLLIDLMVDYAHAFPPYNAKLGI